MATKAKKACPPDWQQKVLDKKKELQAEGPLFGIVLPAAWAPELYTFQQQLRQLLQVKRVAFRGTEIAAMEPPKDESE